MWYDNLDAGDVAITITARTVFVKAVRQPYALVVQVRWERCRAGGGRMRLLLQRWEGSRCANRPAAAAAAAATRALLGHGSVVQRSVVVQACRCCKDLDGGTHTRPHG